jgi:hypothetical protein
MRAMLIALTTLAAVPVTHRPIRGDEPYTITIPGQGWTIAFESPPLREFQGESKGNTFVFQATERKAFNLSLFVEEPKNEEKGHEACFNYYWPKAKRNPMIDQASAKVEKTDKFVKMTYRIKADEVSALNVNYYFAFQGRWIDVHVSRYPAAADDEQRLAAFEKSLVYEVIKENSKSK